MPIIRRAYRLLRGLVTLYPYHPQICLKRYYNRLNKDYQALHSLCYFFLSQIAPNYQTGTNKMLPFLVNMAQLYESFVAEWLKIHKDTILISQKLNLQYQERVYLDKDNQLYFDIDLVLYNLFTGKARYVLDTKYKVVSRPSTTDIQQIVAYAVAKECQEAILIYPNSLAKPLDVKIGNIRVRSLVFSLSKNLDKAGYNFLKRLLEF